MKRCRISQGRSAARWPAGSNRSYTKTRRPGHFPHAKVGAGIPDITLPKGIDSFDSGKEEGRVHGGITAEETAHKKSLSNRRQDALPISPLMNASFFEAREKHHKPKALASKEPTPFQKQLAKNPYALALATPVRRCALTSEALPRFFLDQYTLLPHPDSGKPWWLPRGLTQRFAKSRDTEIEDSTNDDPKDPQNSPPPTPMCEYLLSRHSLLTALQTKGSSYEGALRSLGRMMLAWEGPRKLVSKATFRPDMDIFLLELMRRRLGESLVYLTKRKKGYLSGCRDWKDAKGKTQVGALLWTVDPAKEKQRSPEFAALRLNEVGKRGRIVPVYDLCRLLGEEHMEKVRRECGDGIWGSDVLAMKHKRLTVETQSKLWKLEGYLATHAGADAPTERLDRP